MRRLIKIPICKHNNERWPQWQWKCIGSIQEVAFVFFFFFCKDKQMLNDSSHCRIVVTFTANLVNDYLWNRKKKSFVSWPSCLKSWREKGGKNGKEDFHGSSRRRVSVVKPNIRDSIPNTELSMRVCHPRKMENIYHPLQAPACFYKSGTHNPLCSCLRFYSHVI